MTSVPESMEVPGGYPVGVATGTPAPQNRLSVLLRLIYAIPHLLIISALGYVVAVTGFISWVSIIFTGSIPPGLYRFQAGYVRWTARAYGYVLLLTGAYPPFSLDDDAVYPIRVTTPEELASRNRITVLFRPLLLIPHLIVLAILGIIAWVVWIVAWFAALGTGNVPEGMHNFLAGVLRWSTRVNSSLYLLTDTYPPFSMN